VITDTLSDDDDLQREIRTFVYKNQHTCSSLC